MLADTHVVTEEEMGITTEVAVVARVLGRRTATIDLATLDGSVMTIAPTAGEEMKIDAMADRRHARAMRLLRH